MKRLWLLLAFLALVLLATPASAQGGDPDGEQKESELPEPQSDPEASEPAGQELGGEIERPGGEQLETPEVEPEQEVVEQEAAEQIEEETGVELETPEEVSEDVELEQEAAEQEAVEQVEEEAGEQLETTEGAGEAEAPGGPDTAESSATGDDEQLPMPTLDPAEHEALARKADEVGDFESAAYHWQRAIVGEPHRLRWGAEYRQAVIAADERGIKKVYEDCIDFFKRLAKEHPDIAAVRLNLGYAYVDKIPVEGAITAVILANKALGEFTAALEIEESWLGLYTRGNSYMYWPAIFGRTKLGLADLERALELAESLPDRPYHGRAWAALGDGYWRLEQREKMRSIWSEGLERYPETAELEQRLALEGEQLDSWLEAHFETSARVGTHLREMIEAGDLQ